MMSVKLNGETFVFFIQPGGTSKMVQLQFDILLQDLWKASMENGNLLCSVSHTSRRIEGDKGFVAILSESLSKKKRKAQSFFQLTQKFNPEVFNFNKIKNSEILFEFQTSQPSQLGSTCSVLINNAPLSFGHVLLIPNIRQCHAQSMTLEGLQVGIQVLLHSSHPGFVITYNSLCAGASINHLHLHAYYSEHRLRADSFNMWPIFTQEESKNQTCNKYCMKDFYELDVTDSIIPGFAFAITEDNFERTLHKTVFTLVQFLVANNIAHNICFLKENHSSFQDRCEVFNDKLIKKEDKEIKTAANHFVGRIYIFPRKSQLGRKDHSNFNISSSELLGNLYIGEKTLFDSITETKSIKQIEAIGLPVERFAGLKENLKSMFMELS